MQCTHPFRIKNPDRFLYKKPDESVGSEWLEVPCGHCLSCRIARSREWAIRLLHESEFWPDTCFVTLTYDDEHLPLDGSLVPRDLTLFFKRLRRDIEGTDVLGLKYFACGEYGDRFNRPHYHSIIFGLSPKDKKLIDENWQKGFVKVGTLTYDSCRYVAGYVQKKLYGEGAKEYEEKGIVPPFSRCSKGIGERYVQKYWNKLYSQETVTVRGVPVGLPRYYKKKLDYDGYLSYNANKEVDFNQRIIDSHQDFINNLDVAVKDGVISEREAQAELEALLDSARIDSNLHRETLVQAKFDMKERRKK